MNLVCASMLGWMPWLHRRYTDLISSPPVSALNLLHQINKSGMLEKYWNHLNPDRHSIPRHCQMFSPKIAQDLKSNFSSLSLFILGIYFWVNIKWSSLECPSTIWSSLRWLNLAFLYALFVQWSIKSMKTTFGTWSKAYNLNPGFSRNLNSCNTFSDIIILG